MPHFLDSVPFSGIIRIRDMMYSVERPFRLDQGDVSFDAPDSVKAAMAKAIADNRSHYLQTAGVPRLQELLAEKLRRKNAVPVGSPDEVLVTNGGIHALYILFQALLDPGDEVIIPDPQWPPAEGTILSARGVVVRCPLHEAMGWRLDVDELAERITPRTRVIYLNSPHNPTGGVLTRHDLERIAALAQAHGLWIVSDEAYEDVVFDVEHVSIASIAGMYPMTVPVYTFSKSYAMTGLRLGYMAVADTALRDRVRKVLFFTTSNVSSEWRLLRIPQVRSRLEAPDGAAAGWPVPRESRGVAGRPEVALVGIDRAPHFGGPDRLHSWRRLRPHWRGLPALLFRARPRRTRRRAELTAGTLPLISGP